LVGCGWLVTGCYTLIWFGCCGFDYHVTFTFIWTLRLRLLPRLFGCFTRAFYVAFVVLPRCPRLRYVDSFTLLRLLRCCVTVTLLRWLRLRLHFTDLVVCCCCGCTRCVYVLLDLRLRVCAFTHAFVLLLHTFTFHVVTFYALLLRCGCCLIYVYVCLHVCCVVCYPLDLLLDCLTLIYVAVVVATRCYAVVVVHILRCRLHGYDYVYRLRYVVVTFTFDLRCCVAFTTLRCVRYVTGFCCRCVVVAVCVTFTLLFPFDLRLVG